MIQLLALLLTVNTAGAASLNPLTCFGLLSGRHEISRQESERNFTVLVAELEARGASELLKPLRRQQVKPVFKGTRLPWQAAVSGRQNWHGRLSLTVRDLKFGSEKEKQMALWQTAVAFFELETRTSLWSWRSMLTPDDRRQFDLSMEGSDQAFEYFISTQPEEWRDQKLQKIEALEKELYQVFSSLDLLKSEDLLPARDPGHYGNVQGILYGILGMHSTKMIAPNQKDFAAWGRGTFGGDLAKRHGRSVLFNYYLNFVKRAIVVTMAVQVSLAAPQIASLPSYVEAMYSMHQVAVELNSSPEKTAEFNRQYLENVKKNAIREEKRLKRDIERQKKLDKPDMALVAELEAELKGLYEDYPWLAFPPAGSN